MFTNFFKMLWSSDNKNSLWNFILKEIIHVFNAFRKIMPKLLENIIIKDDKIWEKIDVLLLNFLKKQLHKDLNKKFFHIKEEFIEGYCLNLALFKKEWNMLYSRELNIHALWLLYIKRPIYIYSHIFYFRQKNLFKLFNYPNINVPKYTFKNIYWGAVSIWTSVKIWVFSLIIFFSAFYILLIKRSSILPQTLFFWLSLSMLLYWLLSGFVFFVKKYQHSRFTSVIQRFWRRSYILFWLIESGLLLVFFYLTVNSTQESFYMFDQIYFFKTHLFSWKIFLLKSILVVSLISYSYLLLLNLKWSNFSKNILPLTVISIILFYLVWSEFYQIYWVSNFYANFSWFYDLDEIAWSLEFDGRRTRILNHYIMVLFLLKFWHIIFILGCWIFFLLRANELETITYPLYSFNIQNFIILFLMMWLFMYPWFKHTYHWLAEIPYYWFYVDTHTSFNKVLITDFFIFYYNIVINVFKHTYNVSIDHASFINWFLIDMNSDYNVFIKSTIKNEILKELI